MYPTLPRLRRFSSRGRRRFALFSRRRCARFPPVSDPNEIFELYDAHEYRVIGRATRGECHGHPELIHAVARVHVRDAQGRLLLQRRAASKDIAPGRWDTSVGGHLLPGEEAEAAARREMAEELGVAPDWLILLHRFLMRTPVET